MAPSLPLIDEATASLIQGGVSIIAASTDAQNLPTIVRVFGCRVSSDRRKVTLLAPHFEPFTEAVRASRTIAVTFTVPSTHQALQLKGSDAQPIRRTKNDAAIMKAYADAFVDDVCRLGFNEELIRAVAWCDPSAIVPITFHPATAFQQTPGPRAGTPLAV